MSFTNLQIYKIAPHRGHLPCGWRGKKVKKVKKVIVCRGGEGEELGMSFTNLLIYKFPQFLKQTKNFLS